MRSRTGRILVMMLVSVAIVAFLTGCGTGAAKPSAGAGDQTAGLPGAPATTVTPGNILPVETSPITGEPVIKTGSPVAVAIDNLAPARPQSGLTDADLVYEALTEGGITRYLAIFYSKAPTVVGPVRSARPHFAVLAKEWGAVFAHCGGSTEGLAAIRTYGVVDANEMTNAGSYWRDKGRQAPHNLYTSVDNIRNLTKRLPPPQGRYEFQAWADKPLSGLKIKYNKTYSVEYRYADRYYERVVLDGNLEPYTYADKETGAKLKVSNVIVQFARTRAIYAQGGVDITLVGQGKAAFLLGGRYSEGTWKKDSVEGPTVFLDAAGNKITLAKGQTWIQLVPEDAVVTPAKSE